MLSSSDQEDDYFRLPDDSVITGTLVWYSAVCEREVWLMSKNITPDSEDASLDIGRAIHQTTFQGFRKEVELEGIKIDIVQGKNGIACEVKTSSKYLFAAELQLLYYLYRLKLVGYDFTGEIRIPKEKKIIPVVLNAEKEVKLKNILKRIKEVVQAEKPPPPQLIPFCRRCAYRYFCWSV